MNATLLAFRQSCIEWKEYRSTHNYIGRQEAYCGLIARHGIRAVARHADKLAVIFDAAEIGDDPWGNFNEALKAEES